MKRSYGILCLGFAAVLSCFGAAHAGARAEALVLGDSIAYAYIDSAGYDYINPENFVGFADDLERWLHLDVADAGCPGETTGSFLSATAVDYGCRKFRAEFPLHVDYGATQLQFAQTYLRQHPGVRLVTITLGANDGFLLEDGCASQPNPAACIEAGVPALLQGVAHNLQTILAALRSTGYSGAIVVTNYYSPDYSDAAGTGLIALLNSAIAAPTAAYGAVVADLFSAFQAVAANPLFAGRTCNTGLLNASVANQLQCNVHPAQSGHRLIAQTILETYRKLQ
jgi:lysophospholipase L1-like esterase